MKNFFKSKKIISKNMIVLILILSPIAIISTMMIINIYKIHTSVKGGPDAPTLFDANSDTITITYKENSISIKGNNREKILSILKKAEITEDIPENIEYDVYLDFENGDGAYLSSKNNCFAIIGHDGQIRYISAENCKLILSYLDNFEQKNR